MPSIPAFLLRQAAIGFGISTVFLGALLATNTGGVAELLLGAAAHPFPLALLWAFLGLTFSAVQFGAAITLAGYEAPQGGRRIAVLAPVPVRATRCR